MFDAEKLLGSLISEGLGSRSRRSSSLKWQLGLGAVGVAMAAWEHFNREGAAASAQAPPPPPGPPAGPPTHAMTPPPPPRAPAAPPAVPPPAASPPAAAPPAASAGDEAVLLIRAMICAANADGRIDVDEQTRIVERLVSAGLGSEERAFLLRELAAPPDPARLFDEVYAQVRDPLLADEIYVVSRLALTPDADAEHTYLARLAGRLGLSPARAAELELRCSPSG